MGSIMGAVKGDTITSSLKGCEPTPEPATVD